MKSIIITITLALSLASSARANDSAPDSRCANLTLANRFIPTIAGGQPYPLAPFGVACNRTYCNPKQADPNTRPRLFRFQELMVDIDKSIVLYAEEITNYEVVCRDWGPKVNGDGGPKIIEQRKKTTDQQEDALGLILNGQAWSNDMATKEGDNACAQEMATLMKTKRDGLGKISARFGRINCVPEQSAKWGGGG